MCRAMAFYRTSPFSTPQPQSLPSPSIVGRRLHKFRLRLTTASVCGTIDCSLRLPTLIPDTSGKPPASGALHYNPVRNLRLLFRLVNAGLLLSELRSARSPYTRHVPSTHRGTADGISTHGILSSIVRDATLIALSGREDCSLRVRRHTSSLHCTAANSITFQSTKPRVAQSVWRVKERVSRLRRHPFARGRCVSLHWRLYALPHTPEASSPDKFPFRRLSFHCVADVSNTFRQCRHNALRTLIVRPPQSPMFGQPKH